MNYKEKKGLLYTVHKVHKLQQIFIKSQQILQYIIIFKFKILSELYKTYFFLT